MKKVASNNITPENVAMAGSTQTTIRWLIQKNQAPHFMMRKFEIQPGGQIGLHSHPEEHEIYVLEGKARVFNDKGEEIIAEKDDFLFVPPNEGHGYENMGTEPFIFLCVIPRLNH